MRSSFTNATRVGLQVFIHNYGSGCSHTVLVVLALCQRRRWCESGKAKPHDELKGSAVQPCCYAVSENAIDWELEIVQHVCWEARDT